MGRRLPFLVATVAATALVGLTAGSALAAPTNDPLSGEQWGLTDIKAPEAWPKGAGAGIKVAVVSSGIARHQDLTEKLDGGSDATGSDPAGANKDTGGRGTHLAGIVAAKTNNNEGIAGVAPDARLLAFKAFETESSVDADQFGQALLSASRSGAQVVLVDVPNGFPAGGRDLLRQSLLAMGKGGISVVVGAQGNLPLDDLPVLAVAATTPSGDQEPGTSAVGARGVGAPGQAITSTTVGTALLAEPFGYGPMSGTGPAAAHAAGAVAIVRSAGANANQAADLLRSTARPSSERSLGTGIIDAKAAVEAFKKPAAPTTTATTKKAAAAATPTTSKATGTAAIPKPLAPSGPTASLPSGEPVEPGEGEAAVVPPGAEDFLDGADDGGQRVTIITEGDDRPMGTLAIGFGLLFGVGTGLSVTFRRLADAAA